MTDFQRLGAALKSLESEILEIYEPYLMRLYGLFEKLVDRWTK